MAGPAGKKGMGKPKPKAMRPKVAQPKAHAVTTTTHTRTKGTFKPGPKGIAPKAAAPKARVAPIGTHKSIPKQPPGA